MRRHEEYVDLCKKVRRAMRSDKEKWLNGMMKDMEEDTTGRTDSSRR